METRIDDRLPPEELAVLYDRSLDPVENLRREEELFRKVERREHPEACRFWFDSLCLVRGRAKCVKYGWYNEALAQKMGIKVVERTTGGGVVFHDEGNLNWSFFFNNAGRIFPPAKLFDETSAHIVKALGKLGVDARFCTPNRIDVGGRKVSGMAARLPPRAVLVHGTLLLRTDLRKLNKLCIPPPGCPPVANLEEWVPGVEPSRVVEATASVLKERGPEARQTCAP